MIVRSALSFKSTVVISLQTDEKLAIKASNRLPEFYQEEFPTFQKFIDYYYQYLQSTKAGFTKFEDIKDIDAIGAKYLHEFYKIFAPNIPVFPYIGMADFIRNAKRFFVSKGSEDSYRFLFRVMFGEEVDFKYPKENIFIASSGKWNQKVSLYIRVDRGSIDDTLIGKKLLIKAFDGSTSTLTVKGFTVRTNREVLPEYGQWIPVFPWEDASIWIDIPDGYYEIEVEKFVGQTINPGAKTLALKDPITLEYGLEGIVIPNLNQYEVLSPGEDFLLGSVFSAGKIKFRITALDGNKGIKNIEFLEFGDVNPTPTTFSFRGAMITFKPSAINRYTGYYDNTDGFVSNNNKLHDGYFYQIFSYVIKSKISRELYDSLALQVLHPAGLAMFSELEASQNYTLSISTNSEAMQSLSPIDAINIYDSYDRVGIFFREFVESVPLTDTNYFKVDKFFEDTVFLSDPSFMSVGKFFSETVFPGEYNQLEHWVGGTYVDTGYTDLTLYTFDSYNLYVNNFIYETNPLDWNGSAVWRNYNIWSNGGSTDTSDNNLFAGSPFEWEDLHFWNDNLTWVN